jgi:valyl-tRNA synthetase
MQLEKTYDPRAYEAEIYKLWETSKAFEPSGEGEPFALIMPPPNANAALHIGQATYAKQDVKTRFERLRGKRALYLPGADHAGFETWYVFEKELAKIGKTRFDYTDQELYKMTWDFVQENMHMAKDTYRLLGLSCSWDNFTFTLDEKITTNVRNVFKKMWDEDLIYRGKRLVNFCTHHGTSFSDIEVEYEDRETPLYYLKYGPFELATTRPETKFGDTGVAVHPDDDRYKEFVGQELEIEGVNGPFKVKVIADEMVDPAFGTGVVKITPAHSFDDWEAAQRHNLPVIEVIDKNGKMMASAGRFEGMKIEEAREAVVKALEEKGLLIKVDKEYRNRVGVCYKCGTVIEPMLMEQWFMKMKPLAERAIEAIEADRITFRPANRKDIGLDYLKNIRDWNISRQIPWGIPIPAFKEQESGEWIYNESSEDKIEIDGKTYLRDHDTFDTWMSSTQFPYLALGYDTSNPEQSTDVFKEFFPTTWLQLGREIFNQWGLRMIMMASYNLDEVPFKTLYVNGNIRGEDGKKFSKSLGNAPSAVTLLKEYGSDSLRMGMIAMDNSAGADKAFDRSKIVAGRNFANKLWNVARFIESLMDKEGFKVENLEVEEPKSVADHWILGEINQAIKETTKALEEDEFGDAFAVVYEVVWNKLADWYLEASKSELNLGVLVASLGACLKLAHPFAPFVTETIWQSLNLTKEEKMLVNEQWPDEFKFDQDAAKKFEEVISATEFARKVKTYVGAGIEVSSDDDNLAELVNKLAGLRGGENLNAELSVAELKNWKLKLSDEDLKTYKDQLAKKNSELEAQIANLESRLSNESYVKNAPKELVEESRAQIERLKAELMQS